MTIRAFDGLSVEQVGYVALFAEMVEPLLAADPVLNTHAVGWLEHALSLEESIAQQSNAAMFGGAAPVGSAAPVGLSLPEQWPPLMMVARAGGEVVAAVLQGRRPGLTTILNPARTPELDGPVLTLIGAELATAAPYISLLTGPTWALRAVNEGLAAAGGRPFNTDMTMTLYELDGLREPPSTDGFARPLDPADEADIELLAAWLFEFVRDVGLPSAGLTIDIEGARASLDQSSYLYWCNDSGPVAMAAFSSADGRIVRDAARIYSVYSPSRWRGHGYGRAASHAACQAASSAGAARISLFADLKAVVPNRIYQQLGFVPITEFSSYVREVSASSGGGSDK